MPFYIPSHQDLPDRDVLLKVHRYGYGEFNNPRMAHCIAYRAEGQINCKDYGLTFDVMFDGSQSQSRPTTPSLQ